jgi:hypothetical protein
MAQGIPVAVVREIETPMLLAIIREEQGIEVEHFIAERLAFFAERATHQFEIGFRPRRTGRRIADAVQREGDAVRRQSCHDRQIAKKCVDRGERIRYALGVRIRQGVADIARLFAAADKGSYLSLEGIGRRTDLEIDDEISQQRAVADQAGCKRDVMLEQMQAQHAIPIAGIFPESGADMIGREALVEIIADHVDDERPGAVGFHGILPRWRQARSGEISRRRPRTARRSARWTPMPAVTSSPASSRHRQTAIKLDERAAAGVCLGISGRTLGIHARAQKVLAAAADYFDAVVRWSRHADQGLGRRALYLYAILIAPPSAALRPFSDFPVLDPPPRRAF